MDLREASTALGYTSSARATSATVDRVVRMHYTSYERDVRLALAVRDTVRQVAASVLAEDALSCSSQACVSAAAARSAATSLSSVSRTILVRARETAPLPKRLA